MDILTQGVLGAAAAIASSSRTFGIRPAIIYGFILGIIPDIDIWLGKFIHHHWLIHRGITHSIFFAPCIAYLAYLFCWFYKKGFERQWFWLVFWSLVTHPILDFFTSNGTPLLMPLSYHQFALSSISVIDLNYSLPLFITVIICWFLKSVSKAVSINAFAIFITTTYLLLGIICHQKAVSIIDNEIKSRKFPDNLKCMVGADLFSIKNRYALCFNENTIYETYFSAYFRQDLKTQPSIIWEIKKNTEDLSNKRKINKYIIEKKLKTILPQCIQRFKID